MLDVLFLFIINFWSSKPWIRNRNLIRIHLKCLIRIHNNTGSRKRCAATTYLPVPVYFRWCVVRLTSPAMTRVLLRTAAMRQ